MGKDKNIKEAELILNDLDEDSTAVKVHDPMDELRKSVFSFMDDTIEHIKTQESTKQIVLTSLLQEISKESLSFEQKLKFYTTLMNEKSFSTNSILDLFKPTGKDGVVSPLANTMIQEKPEEDTVFSDKLTKEDFDSLLLLSQFLDSAKKSKETME